MDEFVEITMSSRKTGKQRRIEEALHMLVDSDTLIVIELSRLDRSPDEVTALVNELVARNIRVIILKQNLDIFQHDMISKIFITLFSLFAELEHDLIRLRTKEASLRKNNRAFCWENQKTPFRKASLTPIWSGSRSFSSWDSRYAKSPRFLATTTILHSTPTSTDVSSTNKANRKSSSDYLPRTVSIASAYKLFKLFFLSPLTHTFIAASRHAIALETIAVALISGIELV